MTWFLTWLIMGSSWWSLWFPSALKCSHILKRWLELGRLSLKIHISTWSLLYECGENICTVFKDSFNTQTAQYLLGVKRLAWYKSRFYDESIKIYNNKWLFVEYMDLLICLQHWYCFPKRQMWERKILPLF